METCIKYSNKFWIVGSSKILVLYMYNTNIIYVIVLQVLVYYSIRLPGFLGVVNNTYVKNT